MFLGPNPSSTTYQLLTLGRSHSLLLLQCPAMQNKDNPHAPSCWIVSAGPSRLTLLPPPLCSGPWEVDSFVQGSPYINKLSCPPACGWLGQLGGTSKRSELGKEWLGTHSPGASQQDTVWQQLDSSTEGQFQKSLSHCHPFRAEVVEPCMHCQNKPHLLISFNRAHLCEQSIHEPFFSYTLRVYLPLGGILADKRFSVFRTLPCS